MMLTAVSLTASAAMRMTMSRRYHFTTPATTPQAYRASFFGQGPRLSSKRSSRRTRNAWRLADYRAVPKRSRHKIANMPRATRRGASWNRIEHMGTFVLALHSHLPYARGAGRWPHGEEWVHEAILGTYLPLLVLLHDLRDAGVPYRIVIGLTPILIEQLSDHDINVRPLEYIDDQVVRAENDRRRFIDAGDRAHAELAEFYVGSYSRLREAYRTRF